MNTVDKTISSLVCAVASLGALTALGCGAKSVDLADSTSTGGPGGLTGGMDGGGVTLVDPKAEVFHAQDSTMAVLVDDERVYWYTAVSTGAPTGPTTAWVRGCLKSSCAQSTVTYRSITQDPNGGSWRSPYLAMASTSTNLYWAEQKPAASGSFGINLRTCPVTGCSGDPPIVMQLRDMTSMTIDGSFVYWTSGNDTAVYRCPLEGCTTPQALALNQSRPGAIAVDATNVYWISKPGEADSGIMRTAKDGSDTTGTTIAGVQNQAISIALEGGFIYWTNRYSVGTVSRCPIAGCGALASAPGPTVMANNQPFPSAVAVRDATLYWLNADPAISVPPTATTGSVARCPVNDCTQVVPIATGLSVWAPTLQAMALDETHIYWVAQGAVEPSSSTFPYAAIYRAPR